MSRFPISRRVATAAFLVALAAASMTQDPLAAQSSEYVDATIRCPDGTTRQIRTNADPAVIEANPMMLEFNCNEDAANDLRAAAVAVSSAAAQATPVTTGSATPVGDGLIHCPDGTTRPSVFETNKMGGLATSMACSKPATDPARVSAAMEKKNRDLAISDARDGRVGLWTAVKTAWETGDTGLIASLGGKFAIFAGIAGLVIFLVRRKS